MKFINSLQVLFDKIDFSDKLQEKIILLEENLLKNENLEFDISEKEIIIYNKNFFDNDKISFLDYMEEGKILKNFLLENNLATENNYKIFFKIKKIEFLENPNEIDLNKFIAEVPKNDKKLLAVDDFLNKIKKVKVK